MAEILNKGREVEDLILEGTTWCTIDWMGKINIERLESRTLLTIDWGLTPIDETNYSWTNSVVHTPIIGQTSPVEVKIHNNQNDHNVDRQVVVSFEANFLGYLIDFHPRAFFAPP